MINWEGKNVLVCGGAGMIGSHMARELVKRGARVTIVDDLSSGSEKNIEDIRRDIDFRLDNLKDNAICEAVAKGQEYIFQFAANMGGIGYITAIGADIMRDSGTINLNMLEAVREHQVPNYFYSSSACIYPDHLQREAAVTPLKESDACPAEPDQFYGWEKLFSEKLCEAYQRDYGMNIRVGRFHNIYGSVYTAFDKRKGKAPCHLIIKAINHPEPDFDIWGDGKATRSFLYIDDCIECVLSLMDSNYDKPINVGSDRLVTIDELAQIIISISGKEIVPKYDLSRPQGVRGRNADLSLVKEVLEWEPEVSLEEGLKIVYRWAEEHFRELDNI